MRRFFCLFLLLTLLFIDADARNIKFPVAAIPDTLMENAHVIKRIDNKVFVVSNLHSTTLKYHYAITILDKEGDPFAHFQIYYNKLRKVKNIEGNLYNKNGERIEKLRRKDIKDLSASSKENFMDASRVKRHDFFHHTYPYTIEYSYEVEFNHTFFFPAWIPINKEHEAVQKSSFTVKYPKGYQLRYHSINLNQKPIKKTSNKENTLQWLLENKPAISIPSSFASIRDLLPMVYIAPTEFELGGKKGNMTTWKGFGAFMYQLIKGRDQLPEDIQAKVQELTQNLQDPKAKIKAIYHYFQNHTRYISIQLGIGGWQPFDAKYVASNGYGDCKALVNYMRSLLEAAGIPSYYTIVYAGRDLKAKNRVLSHFPSNQFNHVILCVPLSTDTVWLECTSQSIPAGYLGAFTSGREALMIRPNGGLLISTPKYGINQNTQFRDIKMRLSPEGTAQMNVKSTYKGKKQDFLFHLTKAYSHQRIKKYLSQSIPLPSFKILQFNYDFKASSLPVMDESMKIKASNFASVTGKRLFLSPNIFSKYPKEISKHPHRKTAFHFEKAFSDTDHVVISLPPGYKIEMNIQPIEMKTDFAYYKVQTKMKNNQLIYQRIFRQFETVEPAKDQDKIVDFYREVYKTDRKKIVLVKTSAG